MKVLGIFLIVICVLSGIFTSGSGIMLAALAWVPAYIAKNKGRDFWTWYVYGILLWLVAFFHSLVLDEKEDLKKCPFCGQLIGNEAIICPFCRKYQYSDKS